MERAKLENNDPLVIRAIATTVMAAKDALELGIGKMSKLNVNVRTQEDLPDYAAWVAGLPPALQASADALLDEWMARRAIPATATVVQGGDDNAPRE